MSTTTLRDQIKEKVSLKEIVERTVTLKARSTPGNYVGKSPFVQERTASFYVNDIDKVWNCFSSKKSGGVITWLEEVEGYSKRDALQYLAQEYGIELGPEKEENTETIQIADCLIECQKYFRKGRKVAENFVVNSRQYPESIVDTYELGYSPKDYHGLTNHLIAQGYSKDIIVKSGMAYWDNKRSGEIVTRHVDRVMFPIKDKFGKIVAFTGRMLESGKGAKYLHSANSPLFKKETTLYGLDKALKLVKAQSRIVVCEGTFDAILLLESGIPAVAALGSSVSEWQLKTLGNLCENIYLVFDSDRAGKTALTDTFYKIESLGLDVISYAVVIPDGKDAADYFKEYGSESLFELIDKAIPDNSVVISVVIEEAKKTTTKNSAMVRKVLNELKPYMKSQYSFRYLDMLDRLSEYLNLDRRELEKWVNTNEEFKHNSSVYKKIEAIEFPAPIYEKRILVSCIRDPMNIKVLKNMGVTRYDLKSALVAKCLSIIDQNKDAPLDALEEQLPHEEYEIVLSAYMVSHEEINISALGTIIVRNKTKPQRGPESFASIIGRPRTYSERETSKVLLDMIKNSRGN